MNHTPALFELSHKQDHHTITGMIHCSTLHRIVPIVPAASERGFQKAFCLILNLSLICFPYMNMIGTLMIHKAATTPPSVPNTTNAPDSSAHIV